MANLIFMLVVLALACGFLALTSYEAKRGGRFFASYREALDREVERAVFVLTHVDFSAFLRENAWTLFVRAAHLTVQLSLQLVRWAERWLARAMRYFRHQVASTEVVGEARPFVKALSSFKRELEATRPALSDIETIS